MFRDAVCARVVSRVMRWVGKLREQAERESQDGAWTALGGVAIARPNRTRRRPPTDPSGRARTPHAGRAEASAYGRTSRPRGPPRALYATIPQAFAHPPVHARATKSAINPASAGTGSRVAAAAPPRSIKELLTKAASTPLRAKQQ